MVLQITLRCIKSQCVVIPVNFNRLLFLKIKIYNHYILQTRERSPSFPRGTQPSGSGTSDQDRGRGTPAFRLSVPRGSLRGGGLTRRDSSLPLTSVPGTSLSLSRSREGRGRNLASRGHSASRSGAGRVLPGDYVSFAIDRLKHQTKMRTGRILISFRRILIILCKTVQFKLPRIVLQSILKRTINIFLIGLFLMVNL